MENTKIETVKNDIQKEIDKINLRIKEKETEIKKQAEKMTSEYVYWLQRYTEEIKTLEAKREAYDYALSIINYDFEGETKGYND